MLSFYFWKFLSHTFGDFLSYKSNNIDLSYLSTQVPNHSQTSSLASTSHPKTFFAKHTFEKRDIFEAQKNSSSKKAKTRIVKSDGAHYRELEFVEI